MKSDYFHGLFKHGATGATETKNLNNNADLALPNGVAPNKNEGATEGASLEARTGAASGEVLPLLPLLPQKLSDIRTTHIDLSESRRESGDDGSEQTVTLTNGQAADVSTPSGPIPWHDATPDDRAEIKTALFEGLPVQIYSKVLGEIVWWALDDDVARKLKGGEFMKQGYPPYRGEVIYVWSELLAVQPAGIWPRRTITA